jgi:hypothetical protein
VLGLHIWRGDGHVVFILFKLRFRFSIILSYKNYIRGIWVVTPFPSFVALSPGMLGGLLATPW